MKGPVLDSRRFTVVSGSASNLKCSCATIVQVCRPILILEIKNQVKNIKVSDNASQGIETINRCQFFLSIYFYLIVTLTILSANNVCDAKDSIHNYKSRTEV